MLMDDFVEYYNAELIQARAELNIKGNLERSAAHLPGIMEYRFNQLQDIEAVLKYVNIQLAKVRSTHFKKFLENYPRAMTSRDADKYVDSEDEVILFETFNNDVALIRNQWSGVIKGIENKSFMLGHIVRLRTAGMEDVVIT